jgi:hypothetical protein
LPTCTMGLGALNLSKASLLNVFTFSLTIAGVNQPGTLCRRRR